MPTLWSQGCIIFIILDRKHAFPLLWKKTLYLLTLQIKLPFALNRGTHSIIAIQISLKNNLEQRAISALLARWETVFAQPFSYARPVNKKKQTKNHDVKMKVHLDFPTCLKRLKMKKPSCGYPGENLIPQYIGELQDLEGVILLLPHFFPSLAK